MSAGRAKTTESDVARTAQQKSGMRLIDMPGARSRAMVTMKLMAPAVVEIGEHDQPEPVEVEVRARAGVESGA